MKFAQADQVPWNSLGCVEHRKRRGVVNKRGLIVDVPPANLVLIANVVVH